LGARPDSSITYFDRILKSRPNNAAALAGKANVLEQKQQHDAADAAINKALELAPDEQSVLIAAGNIHFLRYSQLPQSRAAANQVARMEQGSRMVDYYARAMALPDAFIDKPEIVERYASFALYVRAELNRPLDRITKTRARYPTAPQLAATHARLLTAMNRSSDAREPWQVVAQYGRGAMRDAALKALESAQ
jgi:Flp pilus assembly protein TadD